MKGIIPVIVILIVLFTWLGSCSSSSSMDDDAYFDREVEKNLDKLYKKGSDGLYYPKY